MSHTEKTAASLLDQFERSTIAAAATVESIPRSPEALYEALCRITAGKSKILLAEPDDLPEEFFAAFRQRPGVVTHPTDAELAASEVGITDAFAGVARTGSVCISVSGKSGAAFSLFVPFHVAVLDARNIVARPRDVFDSSQPGGKGMERDFVFVTGPSATADMGPLVRGVHGPHRLHVIVLV